MLQSGPSGVVDGRSLKKLLRLTVVPVLAFGCGTLTAGCRWQQLVLLRGIMVRRLLSLLCRKMMMSMLVPVFGLPVKISWGVVKGSAVVVEIPRKLCWLSSTVASSSDIRSSLRLVVG